MQYLLQLFILSLLIPVIHAGIPNSTLEYNAKGYADAAKMLIEGFNQNADPCDDFYEYVCGSYTGNFGISQNVSWMYEQIVSHVATVNDASSLTERIFEHGYRSCLYNQNSPSTNAPARILDILRDDLGFFPVAQGEKYLTWSYVFALMGQWKAKYGIDGLFKVTKYKNFVKLDQIQLKKEVLHPPTAALAKRNAFRDKRVKLIGTFFNATGLTKAFSKVEVQKVVDDIIDFEGVLTMGLVSKEKVITYQKDTVSVYNNFSLFAAVHPTIDLESFFSTPLFPVNTSTKIAVNDYLYFSTLNAVITSRNNSQVTVMNYLGLKLLEKFESDFLTSPPHPFNSTNATRHCAEVMSTYMPVAKNFMYVSSRSDRVEAKASIDPMLHALADAFADTVVNLHWVDEESRQKIIRKKNKLKLDSGWPAWYNFDNRTIILDDLHTHFQDVLNVSQNDFFDIYLVLMEASEEATRAKDADRFFEDIVENPSENNAHYQPFKNTMNIPLGIVTWPLFDATFPQAVNYGGLGHVIGHELVHGYDNTGIRFTDGECKTTPCRILSENSSEAFDDMAQCVVQRYNVHCCPFDNIHCVDGTRTKNENIADIGGLIAAYKAYRRFIDVERKGIEEPRLSGLEAFTSSQIFWIASARKWCSNMSKDEIEEKFATNVHSPSKCRVNQVLQNLPDFAKDFKCKTGSRMFPAEKDRCKVWSN